MSQISIAKAREAFFSTGVADPRIRPEILVSWQRSARLGIDPGTSLPPSFAAPGGSEGLRRAAEPVVRQLLRDIGEDSAAMLLLNPDGVVVGRWSASPRINRILNGSSVEPGRLFDEASAGTTGLGTPLESGCSVVIEGAEHALAALDALTAVGTPIMHPARGTIEGVIDIVGAVGVETSMMLPLVRQAARDIGERLVSGYAADDRLLLDAFLRAERRGPRRPVLAVNDRLIIGNGAGNALGLASQHTRLWNQAQGAIARNAETIALILPSGAEACGRVRAVADGNLVGALIQVMGSAERGKAAPPTQTGDEISRARNETAFQVAERATIRRALAQTAGNKQAAAEVLGVSRATLYRKMARHGIVG